MPDTAFLHIQADGDPTARIIELTVGPIRIGRGAHCEVRLGEPSLADVQCLLKRRGASWQLQPVGPPGPVWVEGKPLDRQQTLEPGVPVRVGDHWITLHATPSDGSWGSYDMPIPVETPGASVHRIDPTLSTFDADAVSARSARNPEPARPDQGDPESLAAEAERLKAWQDRLEQRERWLHDRREERKWEARLKATGEQLRARSAATKPRPGPAGRPEPTPGPAAYNPPRPGYGPKPAATPPPRPAPTARAPQRPAGNAPARPQSPPDFSAILSLLKAMPLDLPPPVAPPLAPSRSAEADERYEGTEAPLISATFDEVDALCAEAAKATFLDPEVEPVAAPPQPELRVADTPVEEPEPTVEAEPEPEIQAEVAVEAVLATAEEHVFEIEAEDEPAPFVAVLAPAVVVPEPEPVAPEPIAEPEPLPASKPEPELLVQHDFDTGTFTTSSQDFYAVPRPAPAVTPAAPVFEPEMPAGPGLAEAPEADWPSARTILDSQGVRESRVVRRGRVVQRGPQPTTPVAPDAWAVPTRIGVPLAVAGSLLMMAFGLGLSLLWVQDDSKVKLAERAAATGFAMPGEAALTAPGDPERAWYRTTAANLGTWARSISRAEESDARESDVRRVLDSARSIAPLDPASRFAQSQLNRESGDGKEPERLAPGQSRDPLLMAWSAGRLKAENKPESSQALYRKALEILVASPIREAEATERVFDEDAQVQRYVLPREALIRAILLDLTGKAEAPVAEWEKALPPSSVVAVTAAKLLREKGRTDADRMLVLAAEAPSPGDRDPSVLAEHHAAQGEALALQAKWAEAEESYRMAIAAMTDLTSKRRFQFNLARILEREGKDAERKDLLEEIRVREPGDELTRRIEAGDVIVSPTVRRPRQ